MKTETTIENYFFIDKGKSRQIRMYLRKSLLPSVVHEVLTKFEEMPRRGRWN